MAATDNTDADKMEHQKQPWPLLLMLMLNNEQTAPRKEADTSSMKKAKLHQGAVSGIDAAAAAGSSLDNATVASVNTEAQ